MSTREVQTGIDKDGNEYKYIYLPPHYCNVFDKAIDQVKNYMPVEQGRALIVEMLEFGKRMNLEYCEDCNNDSD